MCINMIELISETRIVLNVSHVKNFIAVLIFPSNTQMNFSIDLIFTLFDLNCLSSFPSFFEIAH